MNNTLTELLNIFPDKVVTKLDKLSNTIVVCPNHHKMLHYHNGGYKNIVKRNGKLYFVNENGSDICILNNYHLSETGE